ncbi:oligosaccharide flippase family protein [Bradyrhizobium erythrophlei]|uniref:Polysaccharide transporter, PST family n=1 Tax=Bradyrhizobium erythrophlei TaxID=1437360 RepID=A0A1M7T444_9BRAD|nr:oligosaccharide flippase family protein [Bradyrhizobium erythrophlei]SHN65424.1 polysaccharide transporter, PST family [Bradyrhizobium erythrophlei]
MLKTVIGNAGWLGLVQLLNYGLPFLTLPVITRAFGSSIFGLFATMSAYAAYVGLITKFGFDLTGPRRLARIRDDASAISDCVSTVAVSQLVLAAAASSLFVLVLATVPVDATWKLVTSIMLIETIANSLCPQWVFLGLERLRDFAMLQFCVRLATALLIACLIRTPQDLTLLASIYAGAAIFAAFGSFVVLRLYGIRWRAPKAATIASTLGGAFGLFASSLAISLYTTTNVIIVTSVLGTSAGGTFALADRLRQATSGVMGPITSAVYPFICRISGRDETADERRAKQFFFRTIALVSAVLSTTLLLFSGSIVQVVGGDGYQDAVLLLRWMAFLPFIIALSNIFGIQTMIPMHLDRQLTCVVTAAAIIGVAGIFVFSRIWGLNGAGLAVLGVECLVTVALGSIVAQKVSLRSLFFSETRSFLRPKGIDTPAA